jgi:hypothetical protein
MEWNGMEPCFPIIDFIFGFPNFKYSRNSEILAFLCLKCTEKEEKKMMKLFQKTET